MAYFFINSATTQYKEITLNLSSSGVFSGKTSFKKFKTRYADFASEDLVSNSLLSSYILFKSLFFTFEGPPANSRHTICAATKSYVYIALLKPTLEKKGCFDNSRIKSRITPGNALRFS